jgi:hypothetical protein
MLGARSLLCLACVAACAGGPARVRDINGKPLPPSAVSDATGTVHPVECSDGNTYMVITNLPPFERNTHIDAVLRERQKPIDGVCERILENGP